MDIKKFKDYYTGDEPQNDIGGDYVNWENEPIDIKEEPVHNIIEKEIIVEQGKDGLPGRPGDVGSRGSIGPVGPAGDMGGDGPQGERGEQGEKGEHGEQGEKGEKGDQGEQGEIGPQGEMGSIGAGGEKGERGNDGTNGRDGQDGKDGKDGLDGKGGEQGPKGDRGEQGVGGSVGPKGEDGSRGEVGPEGKVGPRGLKGEMGSRGDAGERGEQGPPGEKLLESVKYPLVLDEKTNTVTFDTKALEKVLASLNSATGKVPSQGPDYAGITDWLAAAGGAVGIRDNGGSVIKSVSDINFKGGGVDVSRNGKNVDIEIAAGGGFEPRVAGSSVGTGKTILDFLGTDFTVLSVSSAEASVKIATVDGGTF